VDLNTCELDKNLLDWADVVMTGGMITQRLEVLRLDPAAHAHGKTACRGPDARTHC